MLFEVIPFFGGFAVIKSKGTNQKELYFMPEDKLDEEEATVVCAALNKLYESRILT